jgi:hypothetical protein
MPALPRTTPKDRATPIEAVYMADVLGSDERSMANKLHTNAGISAKYLLAQARSLPPGLNNSADELSLRRAVYEKVGLIGVDAEDRVYTNIELGRAVLSVLSGQARQVDMCRRYAIGVTSLKRWRKAFVAHHGHLHITDISATLEETRPFWAAIPQRGRPTLLDANTESLAAEYIAGRGALGDGYDTQGAGQLLKRLAVATGNPSAKGSRGHVRGFLRRATVVCDDGSTRRLKDVKASNLSTQRAAAITPEKIASQFTKAAELFEEHRRVGRYCGLPAADQMLNTDEGHTGHGKYKRQLAHPDTDRLFRVVDGERVEFHASTVFTTLGTGELLERLCGAVQQGCGGESERGDLVEGLRAGRNSVFFSVRCHRPAQAQACDGL